MSLDITLIQPGNVYKALVAIGRHLEIAAERSDGRSNPDDLIRLMLAGQYQLWVVYENDTNPLKVLGFFNTEVKVYPQRRMLVVQHCVMDPNHMLEVEDRMQELAERFAKDSGCVGIEFVGRPGWKKHAHKYKYSSHSVVYQRFFEEH